MMPSAKERKRALRAALRKALTEMPPERRAAESADICAEIRQLPAYRGARTVCLFSPMPLEVNLLALFVADSDAADDPAGLTPAPAQPTVGTAEAKKRFLFPLTHDDRSLTWHAAAQAADLSPGRMGILEPDPLRSPAVDPLEIDLVLVPGLGFSLEGGRLGFGGGYYDRFLAKVRPDTAIIAVCLSCQLVPAEDLPLEPHDVRIPLVLHG